MRMHISIIGLGNGKQPENTYRVITKPEIFMQSDTAAFDKKRIKIFHPQKIWPPEGQLLAKIGFHNRTKDTR